MHLSTRTQHQGPAETDQLLSWLLIGAIVLIDLLGVGLGLCLIHAIHALN